MSYIPKVGEECLTKLCGMCEPVKVYVKFVGDEHIIFLLDGVERCEYAKTGLFSPLKTPAEIERENNITKALEVLGHDYRDDSVLKMLGILYDAGYRKQPVNPLNRSYATGALHITNMAYDDLVDLGFIVQGGE